MLSEYEEKDKKSCRFKNVKFEATTLFIYFNILYHMLQKCMAFLYYDAEEKKSKQAERRRL